MLLHSRKVCFVSSDGVLDGGGASRSLNRLIEYLEEEGVESYIFEICDGEPLSGGQEPLSLWKELNRKHLIVRSSIPEDLDAGNVMISGLLSDFLIDNNCSLVHLFYLGSASGIASIVCQEKGIPYIASARGSDVERSRYFPPRVQILKYVIKNASIVTCVTKRIAHILNNIYSRDYLQFYNSILSDLVENNYKTSIDSTNRVLVDGRDYYKKGLPILFRAVEKLSIDNFIVSILGDRPIGLIPEEERIVASIEDDQKIEFLGKISHDNVLSILKNSMAFIQASPTEGCPNMLIEAIQCRCPVIASIAGAAAELLFDKENAYLFSPWNPNKLAENIKLIYDDPLEAKKIAQKATILLENEFSQKLEKYNWINAYSRILS